MERVDITLLGRDYSLACAPSEKEALLAAISHVDRRVQRIQETGRVSGNERIAVMAAIQIALELLAVRAPDGPLGNIALGDFKRRIEDMHQLIDNVVGTDTTTR